MHRELVKQPARPASKQPDWRPAARSSLGWAASVVMLPAVGRRGWWFLDGSGQAAATVDLTALPAGFLSGLQMYAQGLTLTAQNTLSTAFHPLRLTFL